MQYDDDDTVWHPMTTVFISYVYNLYSVTEFNFIDNPSVFFYFTFILAASSPHKNSYIHIVR